MLTLVEQLNIKSCKAISRRSILSLRAQNTTSAIHTSSIHIFPVNGMATYNVVATGTVILLPKELENAIEVTLASGNVNGSVDVEQGWYELVNNFAYVDPNMQHDNPLIDNFLVPDPIDNTILRRQYTYPGLFPNSTVTVTGAKRYIPIKSNNDFL